MSGGQNSPKAMHELKTSEPDESAVRSIGIVVPPRRERKPRMGLMMAAMGAASMMAHSRGNVVMVDDVTKRRDDNEPQLTASDMDAILAAKIKRERKALLKKMRHNAAAEPSGQKTHKQP